MDPQIGWAESAKYWKTVPRWSNVVLLAGVFLLFTAIGLVLTFFNDGWLYVPWAILLALTSGIFAVGWAYAGFRRVLPLMFVLGPLQFGVNWTLGKLASRYTKPLSAGDLSLAAIRGRLHMEGGIMMLTMVASYALIVYFIRGEGKRVFGHLTEMRLAHEVHQTLVPEITCRIGPYELYGISIPSGQVGGDLVDVIRDGSRWIAYVADVSGHGVAAGMVMAMVKSAVHMGSSDASLATFLANLNGVLKRLSAVNVFATFACIVGGDDSTLEFSLAGHHPILLYRSRTRSVEERSVPNPALALFSNASFRTESITCEEGDVLAVVTDGLTEAADKSGKELGLDPLKGVLTQTAEGPLQTIAQALQTAALRHGTQIDDQTVLLVRRSPRA